jgi:hypothetical protein
MDLATPPEALKAPTSTLLLATTTPAASASLHENLKAGQAVRSFAAVHFQGPAPVFGDIRSVPAAVPPLPNAGGVRGGRPSYAAKQGAADFAFDYGLAFSLRPAGAFARGGFGSTCIGRTCGGKGAVYARGSDPFIWERKRNRGGAIVCRGKGGHLLCLRCVEVEYEAERPFVSSATGVPVPQQELFTKYEVFPQTKEEELREVRSGEEVTEGGHQFFVQRRDLAPCPYCREPKAAAPLRRGVKRALEEGPNPRELGTVAILSELSRSRVPPIAVATGLFLVPLLDAPSGRLLDIFATDRGLGNVPRLVKVDHMGSFRCLCGQKMCRDHEMGLLEATCLMGGWWQGGEAIFTTFDDSRPFVREVTSGVPWVLPLDQQGGVGDVLIGVDAKAWKDGPHLRVFVVSNPGEKPVVCVLGGEKTHCSDIECSGSERCRHLLRVLSKQTLPRIERTIDGGGSEATRTLAERRAERVGQRETGTSSVTIVLG